MAWRETTRQLVYSSGRVDENGRCMESDNGVVLSFRFRFMQILEFRYQDGELDFTFLGGGNYDADGRLQFEISTASLVNRVLKAGYSTEQLGAEKQQQIKTNIAEAITHWTRFTIPPGGAVKLTFR